VLEPQASSVSWILRERLRSASGTGSCELLGYRAAALDYMTGCTLAKDRPNQPESDRPEMAVEAPIFGRDDGLRQ